MRNGSLKPVQLKTISSNIQSVQWAFDLIKAHSGHVGIYLDGLWAFMSQQMGCKGISEIMIGSNNLRDRWDFRILIVILQYINEIMGVTKTDLFTIGQNDLSQVAKAFAHPARIAIIHHLLKANACINSDLVQELGLAQATISQHLRELKAVGIIRGTIEGVSVNYCIDPVRWNAIKKQFNELFEQYTDPCGGSCC